MRKLLIATCLPVFFCLTAPAQKLPKTLLWRISGNGLTKPSYLYGTMHLQDPRLFNLGDSLLQAITASDGFANELDMNQLTPLIVDMVKEQIMKSLTMKEILSEKALNKYGPSLSKKFNKPAAEITTLDILKEKNKWINDSYKGQKMETFLDVFLMDLAYRQGKWLGGVEDFSDQSGLLNSVVDESDIKQLALGDGSSEKGQMENMITTYQNNDLDGVQNLLNGMDSSTRDVLLIKRNKKMAFRMDSLARARSMVFAVGAAHLPGNDGLISLLRAKGFTLTPVFSSRKTDPKNYPFPEIIKPWVEVKDPDGHYKVMMPGNPGTIRLYGIVTLEMYFNIFNSTWYMASSLGIPYDQKGVDSVERTMLKELFGNTPYQEEKTLNMNGVPGKSWFQKDMSGYKKVYMLYKDNQIYYAVGYSQSNSEKAMKDINHFFDSYEVFPVTHDKNTGLMVYTDSIGAYRISVPAKPRLMEDIAGTGKSADKTNLMFVLDPQTGTYYLFGANKATRGYSYQDDSSTIRAIREGLLKKIQDITRDTIYSSHGNAILELNGSMLNGAMLAKAKIILRGNLYYNILIMYGRNKWNQSTENVFQSFQLLDYKTLPWEYHTSPDSLFTAWLPSDIIFHSGKEISDSIKIKRYESYDSNRSNTFNIKTDTLGKYFWAVNDSALWKWESLDYLTSQDTILTDRIFRKDGMLQYEFLKRPKGANNVLRMQMMLRGNLVYRITTVQEPGSIRDENVNRLYEGFHFNQPPPESHVFESKAVLLLKDLQSPDSLQRRQANQAISHAPFSQQEIPLLQQALLITYPVDSSLNESTNRAIAEKIIALNDSSSCSFAAKYFTDKKDPEVKNALAGILSTHLTKENYKLLGQLLMTAPPATAFPGWVSRKWYDSLQVSVHLFPTILPLLKDSLMDEQVLDLGSDLLDSNLLNITAFGPWQDAILKYADHRYRVTVTDTLNFTVSDYSVINILKRLNNAPSNAMLKKWLKVKWNLYHKQAIVLALLENKQPVDPRALNELAASMDNRIQLYRNLKKYNQAVLFPAKYKTQSYFAEGLAEEASSDFSYEDPQISLIKTKEMKVSGKTSRFFFYDLYVEEDNEHWLVVSGPYNLNKTDISFSAAQSRVWSDEQYDADHVDEQIKAAVKDFGKD